LSDVAGADQHSHDSTSPLVQREIRLLIVLSVAALLLFAATDALAGWTRRRHMEVAAVWFARGEAAAARGDDQARVMLLERAVETNRSEPRYALALARALSSVGRSDEARRLLLQLRDARPDDVEINYRLARIAAASGEVSEAVRYYNHAMYGVGGGPGLDRPTLRAELIAFLLDHDAADEARSELTALVRELPDQPDAHLRAAALAQRAGDQPLAYAQDIAAATLDPTRVDAWLGAGRLAFALRDFATADTDLSKAIELGADNPDATRQLALVRRVRSIDPLGPRLSWSERSRRLAEGAAWAVARLDACSPAPPAGTPDADSPLRTSLKDLRRHPAVRETDDIDAALDLIRETLTATASCATPDPLGNAWALVTAAHPGRHT
jgi:tetratricopeptide (TPR) repeat protein